MNYQKFTVDDFVIDTQFRNWVLKNEVSVSDFDWEGWLRSNPQKYDELMKAKSLIEASVVVFERVSKSQVTADVNNIIDFVQQSEEANLEVTQRRTWKYFAAAASVLFILSATWFFTIETNEAKNSDVVAAVLSRAAVSHWMAVNNTEAQNKLVVLPDGSSLLLKKGSRVTFPSEFSEKTRNVYLYGEAFFEVVKNAEHPFIIYSNSFTTEVVGTSFMLTDFPDNKSNGIVVKTGVVRVSSSAFEETKAKISLIAELRANERWQNKIKTGEELVSPTEVTNDAFTEKIQTNPFKYRNAPVAGILKELEQTYSVKIKYNESEMEDLKLSATLDDEPFFRKLDLITMALDLDYTVNGNEITVSKAK